MSFLRRAIHAFGLSRGTTAVTDGGKTRTVQMKFMTLGNTADGVTVMQHYGFASRPHANCDYAVSAMDHDPGKSVAVASNDQRYQLPLVEGEAGIHDDQGQYALIGRETVSLKHKSGSSFVLEEDGSISINPANGIVKVAGQITGTGNEGVGMAITGSISATADVIAGVGATNISLLNLKVSGVEPGSGESGIPVPGT